MPRSFEQASASSHIAPIDFKSRRDFIIQNTTEFQIPISGRYRGSEKQNIALLKFLKTNEIFRQKWEKELLNLEIKKMEEKEQINKSQSDLKKEIAPNIQKGTVLHNVTTSAFTHSEDPKWGNAAAVGGKLKNGSGRSPQDPISCAANWALYPPYTKFIIDGKYYEVHDYGSFVSNYPTRIVLYKNTKNDVNNWGLRRKDIQLVEMGDFNKAKSILSEKQRKKYKFVRDMLSQLPA